MADSLILNRFQPGFFFFIAPERNDAIKGAGFHAAEAEAAGGRHFIILVADVDKEWAFLFGLAFFALLAFVFIETDSPEAAMGAQGPVGGEPAEMAAGFPPGKNDGKNKQPIHKSYRIP